MNKITNCICSTIIVVSLLFLAGCDKKEILPEEKFIEIYVDILVAQDTTSDNSIKTDSLKVIVLRNHNTSENVYKNTLEYYNESAERWEQFFDKTVLYVEELRTKSEE